MKHNLFSNSAQPKPNITWRRAFESPRVMVSVFNKLILLLTDGLTKEWCIATHLFWKECRRIGKRSGWLFLALYIKQARVALQKSVSGDKKPDLSVYVSLTRGGLPRIIPPFHRRRIREKDVRIIKLYMSLFSVSRSITLAAKISADTFASITSPSDLSSIQDVASEMRPHLIRLIRRYIPGVDRIPLNQGLQFTPTWKTSPSLRWYRKLLMKSGGPDGKSLKDLALKSSIFHILPYEIAAFQFLMVFTHSKGEQWSQGTLWPPYTRYAFDRSFNKTISELSLEWFEARIGPFLPSCEALGVPPMTGSLSATLSGDGKRRLFAIGNYINQRLLSPIHTWLASLLKRIPQDGTFNQLAPLDRLSNSTGWVHSVDLKSATDRWPLLNLFELMQALFDRSFASAVVNSTLGTNVFDVTFLHKRVSVSFVAGQPLGYHASWPLFALSHHVLLWYAAEQAYPGLRFTRYAILGDDVVINDTIVKDNYSKLLQRMGVSISVAKSLDSPLGCCEFAKKFRLYGMAVDASPVSIQMILEAYSPIGWYQLVTGPASRVRFSTKLRLAGFGFKACSRYPVKGRRGFRYWILLVHSFDLSFEMRLSIVIGVWIHPNLVGRMIDLMMDYLHPKDPILPPAEAFAYPGMMDFNEYTLYQGWMREYLKYLKWYALLVGKPDICLDDFLKPPIYIRTWFRPSTDENQFRYGIMFRLYDMAYKMRKSVFYSLE